LGPLPKNARYQSLDIWRGIACLMVVVLHSSFYSAARASGEVRLGGSVGGSLLYVVSRMGIGVQLFFVISGYCIAATADSMRRKRGATGQYFVRRLRRIFPPYWVALALTVLVVAIASHCGFGKFFDDEESPIPRPLTLSPLQWLGNITLTETWRQFVLPWSPYHLQLGPAWSLCYEEQFYVVCGLLLLICPRKLFVGCAIVSIATACFVPWTFLLTDPPIGGVFFAGRWLLFAAGVLVYCQVNSTSEGKARVLLAILIFGLIVSVVFRYGFLGSTASQAQKERAFEFVVGSAFALLLVFLHRWDTAFSRSALLRPLAFCGTMCYSLYLIHWPIAKAVSHGLALNGVTGTWPTLLLTIPLATAVSVGAARVFYLLVERRFLNGRPTDLPGGRPPSQFVMKPALARGQFVLSNRTTVRVDERTPGFAETDTSPRADRRRPN
jgi:peptidoglycan/LPS O-acetylase OafA/YrhL